MQNTSLADTAVRKRPEILIYRHVDSGCSPLPRLVWPALGCFAHVQRGWNLPDLTGIQWLGIPLEALLLAFTFGLYWPRAHEHFMWRRLAPEH